MAIYSDVKIGRILNPTSIDLGEFVINPYKGCEFACLYCYVRSNRTTSREKRSWGTYVDARVNAVERLEKELLLKKPRCVLLGSTTECFQPLEVERGIAGEILKVLNKHKIFYVILTRSPLISRYLALLQEGFCRKIYFTVNDIPLALKALLEPKSPSFEARIRSINELLESGIDAVPYFSPVIPGVSDFKNIFREFPRAKAVEFEGLNFNLNNTKEIVSAVTSVFPGLTETYERMFKDEGFYRAVWEETRRVIVSEAIKAKKSYNVTVHEFGQYFKNTYL